MADRPGWPRRARNSAYAVGLARLDRRLPFWPIERIGRLQRRHLRSIVRHAYDAVPFYRRELDERGLRPTNFEGVSDLERLPVIDGLTVQEKLDQFTSTAYDDRSREGFHTSGSASGVRRTIYWDTDHVLRGIALAERDRLILTRLAGEGGKAVLRELVASTRWQRYLGALVGDRGDHQRISIFPGDAASRTIRVIWSEQTLIPRKAAHHHFLRPHLPLEEVAERMNEIRPRIVFSYGSYVDQFFRFLADRGQTVALPRVWMYTGDGVSSAGRELAERSGCMLYSVYSAVEAHRLGFQCERRTGLHLNIDLFGIRLIDEEGQEVEPGQPGDLIVSNLHNRAMVLLNYRLGDRAVVDPEPCPCGRSLPLMSRLEGRRSEVLRLADGREISSLALDNLFTRELEPTLKAQLAQTGPGEIRWRIVPFSSADREQLRSALLGRAREVLGDDTKVSVEFVADIPATAQGKFLRTVAEPTGAERGDVAVAR
jgi:phenylacetate-CoA ligase